MKDDNINFIEVRNEDGDIVRQEGEDAKETWNWIIHCQEMAMLHGSVFKGKSLNVIVDSKKEVKHG
jgi:hypothetical protein